MAEEWTKAQRQAWGYIESYVSEGYTASEALKSYRESGGAIRTQDWYREYERYQVSGEEWNQLNLYRSTDTLPDHMFIDDPYKFSKKYVMQYSAYVRNADTGEIEQVYRQVESGRQLTKQQWLDAANNNLIGDKSMRVEEVQSIGEIGFFRSAKYPR